MTAAISAKALSVWPLLWNAPARVILASSRSVSGVAGLLLSFHTGVPAGPAIILVAGVLYAVSVIFGRVGGLARHLLPRRHLEA